MRKAILSALLFLIPLGLLFPSAIQAEPYIALRQGLKCSFCHVNRTGGGKRKAVFASIATAMLQPSAVLKDAGVPAEGAFDGTVNEHLSVGANLRVTNTSTFREEPGADGEVANDDFFRPADSNDFDVDEGVGYLEVDLLQNRLTAYIDESFAPGGASNREAVAIVSGLLPAEGYVKVGQFFPPFGLRLQDDGAFTRMTTGFNFDRNDTGVEIGFAPGPAFLAASITNGDGTDGNGFGKQFNIHGYGISRGLLPRAALLAGGSFAYNDPADRTVAGVHGGVSYRQFTLLAEIDWIREDTAQDPVEGWATHTEINWQVLPWLNVKFGYDFLEPDTDVDEDEKERYVLGCEAFLHENLQGRLQYRVNNDVPQRPQGNYNELIAELHVFF